MPEPEGSSEGGKRKRKSKPTGQARRKRQRTKDRYAHAREDAQLEGLIPTTPEEALQPERVPPSAQSSQPLPELIAEAIRKGWKTAAEKKQALVEELVTVVLDRNAKYKDKINAFNALVRADRNQWEQDNPIEAGKAKGASSTVAVSVESNMLAVKVIREALDDTIGGSGLLSPLAVTGAPGDSRFDGEVETGAASTSDQRYPGQSMVDAQQSHDDHGALPTREVDPL